MSETSLNFKIYYNYFKIKIYYTLKIKKYDEKQ